MPFIYHNLDYYYRNYIKKYETLENNFLDMEPYISIDSVNFYAFSEKYSQLYQAICSETDNVLQFLCKTIDPVFNKDTMAYYCKCILGYNSLFANALVSIPRAQDITIQPWLEWKYEIKPSKKGSEIIEVQNPKWWTIYNKLKHDRMSIDPDTNRPYYKSANQLNVIMSLAALYIANSYGIILLNVR